MAGRGGRGGGGRGRGRASMSFSVEQLGFSAGEALPGPTLQPPPLYPPLEHQPVPLQSGPEMQYLIALKQEFIESLHDSPAYLIMGDSKVDVERYSDRYQAALVTSESCKEIKLDWSRLPLELRPLSKKVRKRKGTQHDDEPKSKVKKFDDIAMRLEELEKNEEKHSDVEDANEEDDKDGDNEEENEEIDEEDADEEMDDGTDYVNNYFDNGEGYLDDEEDNLDDGPVY